MEVLTKTQINNVVEWMNQWEQLRNTAIPIRFEQDWTKQLDYHLNGDELETPPIGLVPKWIRDEQRKKEIIGVITRYVEHGKTPPKEWIMEFANLCD